MGKKIKNEFWENLFRITVVSFIIMPAILYLGFLMRIKPLVWAPIAALICFFTAKGIVRKFFWKKSNK